MKIFTATFYKNNYGSALQAYALQHKIYQLGGDAVLIEPGHKETKEKNIIRKIVLFFRPEKHYGPMRKVRRYLQRKLYTDKNEKINRFVKENLQIVKFEDCISDIDKGNCILLAGSDQIWSILNHPVDDFYLFDYADSKKVKKVSYAASIGISTLNDTQKAYYKLVLKSFNAVSFREKMAYETLKDELKNSVVRQDIDPTLLHTGDFWAGVAAKRQYEKPYLFIYMLRPSRQVICIAKKIAKEHNLDIVYMGLYVNNYKGIKTIADAGVEEFLSYMMYAEYVVTNSFHGTVFSLLFGKKFASVRISSTTSRVESLLEMVGLSNHLINGVSDIESAIGEYDVNAVNVRLSKKRAESLQYLREIVEGCNWGAC